MVPSCPSEAIELGLCPACLGTGEAFHVVEQVNGPCSGCGGLATLDAMLARQCGDPFCPDHGYLSVVPSTPDEVDQ